MRSARVSLLLTVALVAVLPGCAYLNRANQSASGVQATGAALSRRCRPTLGGLRSSRREPPSSRVTRTSPRRVRARQPDEAGRARERGDRRDRGERPQRLAVDLERRQPHRVHVGGDEPRSGGDTDPDRDVYIRDRDTGPRRHLRRARRGEHDAPQWRRAGRELVRPCPRSSATVAARCTRSSSRPRTNVYSTDPVRRDLPDHAARQRTSGRRIGGRSELRGFGQRRRRCHRVHDPRDEPVRGRHERRRRRRGLGRARRADRIARVPRPASRGRSSPTPPAASPP